MDKETKDYIDSSLNEIIDSKFDKIIDRLLAVIVPASSACGSRASVSEQTDPLADWNDPDIYPVWKDETKHHILDNLDGIRVPVIDGTEILLYPKYKECALLPENKIDDWSAKEQRNPLYADVDQHKATDELLSLGSEAAEFVRQFSKDLALPIQLLAIAYYKEKINELSKLLGGDLLSVISSYWWALLRYRVSNAWCVHGTLGTFSSSATYDSYRCLPVSLFKRKLKS